jgi:septal ring factor EnvC (AmiA/AmiB activator)
MTTEPTTPDPQNATLNESDPKPATGTSATDATSGTTTTEPTIDDLKAQVQRIEAALKKANTDAKTHRLENEQLKQFKEQIEDSQRSEQDKRDLAARKLQEQLAALQKERDDALSLAQTTRVQSAIQVHAIQQGIDPKLATRLLDTSTLEFDETTGNPTNLDTVFKAMVEEYKLTGKAAAPTSGGATNPPRSSGSQSAEELANRFRQGKLTREEYASLPIELRMEIQRKL